VVESCFRCAGLKIQERSGIFFEKIVLQPRVERDHLRIRGTSRTIGEEVVGNPAAPDQECFFREGFAEKGAQLDQIIRRKRLRERNGNNGNVGRGIKGHEGNPGSMIKTPLGLDQAGDSQIFQVFLKSSCLFGDSPGRIADPVQCFFESVEVMKGLKNRRCSDGGQNGLPVGAHNKNPLRFFDQGAEPLQKTGCG